MRSLVNPLSLLFLSFILLINRLVNGDAVVVSPSKGEAFSPAGDVVTIPIKIVDNGKYPSMVDFTSFTILLCTGPNDNIRCFYTISQEAHLSNFVQSVEGASTFYTYDASFKSSLVGSGQFYIQFVARIGSDQYTIHYSPRFYLVGMVGATTTYTYIGTAQPGPQFDLKATGTEFQCPLENSRSFTIPYTEQTGPCRYAPMQMQPGTKVTATRWTRKYPTSAVTFYTTNKPGPPDKSSTITPGWSYSVTSAVNWASPALFPSQNGGWYEPKKRMSFKLRKINN